MISFITHYSSYIILILIIWLLHLFLNATLRRRMNAYRDVYITLSVDKESNDVDIVNVNDNLETALKMGQDIVKAIDNDKYFIKVVYLGVGFPEDNLIAQVPNEKSKKVHEFKSDESDQ